MSGDYSRDSFDPRSDFSAVLMQQGRVALDADWNELVDILARRLRAETVDVIGRCVVPRETPNGFAIEISGTGDGKTMRIGRGRLYLHGLLAENHGEPPLVLDLNLPRPDGGGPTGVLAEPTGSEWLDYDAQPYLPQAPPLPEGAGPHLVYLDVWEREVTAVEDEELLEPALGGVDTTSRRQTVWQVKVFANVNEGVTCATPDAEIEGWVPTTAPSAGVLSTRAVPVEQPDDPCLLPPGGGYSGLENQLYRVEIHDGGPPGSPGATFKWSRDNATVASPIEQFLAPDRIAVTRIGRDNDVLRFNQHDWVEVTDDIRELSGVPGVMRRVEEIADESRTIVLSSGLPPDLVPSGTPGDTPLDRHSRLRRWDQNGQVLDVNGNVLAELTDVASGGVIPIPAEGTSLVLEHGVEVTFSLNPVGGEFRPLDYWTFAARTADRSVEELDEAPPKGIHHHYCRLAVVSFPESVADCRTFWPPEFGGEGCGCDVCVTAESHNSGTLTIQQAVAQVRDSGGTVCLSPGNYTLGSTPVVVDDAQSVRIAGAGSRTVLSYAGEGAALTVRDSTDVRIEDLAVVVAGSGSGTGDFPAGGRSAVLLRNVTGMTVQNVAALVFGEKNDAPAIALEGYQFGVDLKRIAVQARAGIGTVAAEDTPGRLGYLLLYKFVARDCFLFCGRAGVTLGPQTVFLGEARVLGNTVLGCDAVGILTEGLVAPAGRIDIEGNILSAAGYGIVSTPDSVRISGNDVAGSEEEDEKGGRTGILLLPHTGKEEAGGCLVVGNRLRDLRRHGVGFAGPLRSCLVKQNVIERTGDSAIFMDVDARAEELVIENNLLTGIARQFDKESRAVAAIKVHSTDRLRIAGNTIRDVADSAPLALYRAGIDVIGCHTSIVRENTVVEVGPAQGIGESFAIRVQAPFSSLQVVGNALERTTSGVTAADGPWFAVGIVGTVGRGAVALAVGGGQGTVAYDDRTHLYISTEKATYGVGEKYGAAVPPAPAAQASVTGNHIDAWGTSPLVDVFALGDCVFTDNQCLLPPAFKQESAVAVRAERIISSNNVVRRGTDLDAMHLVCGPRAFTVLGNVTSGPIRVEAGGGGLQPLPAPWNELNRMDV